MYTEICKIIEAAIAGDQGRAESYARLLAQNLDKAGQPKEATRVLRALGDATAQSPPAGLDELPPSPAYQALCKAYDERGPVPLSPNADFQRCLVAVRQLPHVNYAGPPYAILGAAFEYLAGEAGRAVAVEEVADLLAGPWRAVLVKLSEYPPAAEQLLYTRLLAAWQSNPDEVGTHAGAAFEEAQQMLHALLVEEPARLAKEAQEAAAERLRTTRAELEEIRRQEWAAQLAAERRRDARTGKLLALLFGILVGVAVGVALVRGL
jgi:hypothetical protein